MSSLDSAALAALKARHIAFFQARVVSARAEAEWQENLAKIYRDLLATPLSELGGPGALADVTSALLTGEAIERAVRPLATRLLREALRELCAEKGRVGDHVPAIARQRLMTLLELPGL